MTSDAPCRRTAAGRQKRKLPQVRVTAATANWQKPGYGKSRVPAGSATLDLFGEDLLPEGMKYQADFLSAGEEQTLLRDAENLPFKEFEFHGFTGKRRTVSFGWRYDSTGAASRRRTTCLNF